VSWSASTRYDLAPAPGGIGLVHSFLNTAAAGKPRQADLLADPGSALGWLAEAPSNLGTMLAQELATLDLSAHDVAVLRRLRERLLDVVVGVERDEDPFGNGTELTITAAIDATGAVTLMPRGAGWRYVWGALLIEIARAREASTWARLKACRNERCRGVFYDRSRNNSGVWHDVHTCGNVANLRASRARRSAASGH
jgi:hypothetical protein